MTNTYIFVRGLNPQNKNMNYYHQLFFNGQEGVQNVATSLIDPEYLEYLYYYKFIFYKYGYVSETIRAYLLGDSEVDTLQSFRRLHYDIEELNDEHERANGNYLFLHIEKPNRQLLGRRPMIISRQSLVDVEHDPMYRDSLFGEKALSE